MSLFKRKQDTDRLAPSMPPELTEYYQAEKRQQAAVTWLLGFATLAITVAIAFGLFLSARWIVQKVRKQPAKTPDTTQQVGENNPGSSTQAPAVVPTAQAPATTPAQPGTSSTTPTTMNTSGPQVSSTVTTLPNTGPAETLAVFFVATAVGTFAYQLKSRKI